MESVVKKIVLSPKLNTDTIVAVLLLKEFGEKKFPNIKQAPVEFLGDQPSKEKTDQLEKEGNLVLGFSTGRFGVSQSDNQCLSLLVAGKLEIKKEPSILFLLKYVEKDCQKKGLESLDCRFEISLLVNDLIEACPENPRQVLEQILPILRTHINQQKQKGSQVIPEIEKLEDSNKLKEISVLQDRKALKIALLECQDEGLLYYLQAQRTYDVIVHRQPSGYTNILTRRSRSINLHDVAGILRVIEAQKKKAVLKVASADELFKSRRLAGVEEWMYDPVTNSLLNSPGDSESIDPTRLSLDEIAKILNAGLNFNYYNDLCPRDSCIKDQCPLFEFYLPRCRRIQKNS